MNTKKLATRGAAMLVLTAVSVRVFEFWVAGENKDALAAANRRQTEIGARIGAMESRIQSEANRAQAVESDNAELRAAVQKAQTAKAADALASAAPITHDAVEARYQQAKQLAQGGDAATALKEYLWCFDVGMRRVSSYAGVRGSYLLEEIVKLGPVGIAALEDRRNQARQLLVAGTDDSDAASDLVSISRKLNDEQAVLAVYDAIPPGESRHALAIYAFGQFVAAQRYSDALTGRPYGNMSASVERAIQSPPGRIRDYEISSAATNIEVLAGAGDLAHAQALMARLLAADSSATTKTTVAQHLARAGHPELTAPQTQK